jgi:hypothetical protein
LFLLERRPRRERLFGSGLSGFMFGQTHLELWSAQPAFLHESTVPKTLLQATSRGFNAATRQGAESL